MRALIDRTLALIAKVVVGGFFRRHEIAGRPPTPGERPVLVVANHFNGFVDPIAVTAALGRLPRFLAKATLGRILPVRWLLSFGGVVLVQRREDQLEGAPANESAFAACHRALARRATVAIFPEGTTHDRPHIVRMHTGAARIALGARAAGAGGLHILPAGLTFEDKLALRSGVLVEFGEPIDLDAEVARRRPGGTSGEDDHALVDELTGLIGERLRAVSPDFATVDEWRSLEAAAEVALATPERPEPALAAKAQLSRRLGRQPDDVRAGIRAAIAEYVLLLHLFRLDDREIVSTVRRRDLLRSLVVLAIVYAVTGPFVLTGAVVNVVPVLIVGAASMRVRTPVTKGTVRVLLAVVTFPLAWIVAANLITDGTAAVMLTAAGLAVAGFLALLWVEGVVRFLAGVVSWRATQERSALLQPLGDAREHVVTAVATVAHRT